MSFPPSLPPRPYTHIWSQNGLCSVSLIPSTLSDNHCVLSLPCGHVTQSWLEKKKEKVYWGASGNYIFIPNKRGKTVSKCVVFDISPLILTIKPGDQPWDFFGRTDAKAETPVLWPPHAKS